MRAKSIGVMAAFAAAVGLTGVAYVAWQSRIELEMERERLTAEAKKLGEELKRSREADARSRGKEQVATTSLAPGEKEKSTSKTEAALPPRIRPRSFSDLARDNPQLWNEFIRSKRAEFSRFYLPLLQRMQVSAQQREKFVDILTEWLARSTDISAAAKARGLEYDDPVIKALSAESEKRMKAELEALLGPAAYREYETFERAMPARGYVDGLAVQLAATAPISAQQADRLERALAETNPTFAGGGRAEPGAMDWVEADRRAKEILPSEQFAVWQRGVAHNTFGGSRRAQELEAVYRRAVERAKEAVKAQGN